MRFPRVYTDETGETRIGLRDIPEHETRVGPPPNPVGHMTEHEAVSTFVTFSAPAGTEVPSHNAPQPYICIVLSGEGEVKASDGTTVTLGPGGLIYCDDLTGKGHITRSITDLQLAFINRRSAA
jgi:quercetin dioxygenase-like cupin family protein